MNPMQLIQMLRSGQNPQQLAMNLLESQMGETPMGQNLLNLAKNGRSADIEQIARNTTTMIYTPTAVSTYGNVFGAIFIDIPRGCCGRISVRNISTIPVSVQNANLIVERVA